MEQIKSCVKLMTEKCLDIHDEIQDKIQNNDFGYFLSSFAEENYKNEKILSFLQTLNNTFNYITKEELVDYLETTKKRYVKTRLQENPVNFSTNPMANLIRLWDFEFYGEMIKKIDILLSKC